MTDRHGNDSAGRRAVLAVLGLGFRPFYLLAGLFAVVAVPLWVAAYTGMLSIDGYLAGFAWHQHEMLFGFAVAVIAGFLLTAVRNWTGCATPTGFGLFLPLCSRCRYCAAKTAETSS